MEISCFERSETSRGTYFKMELSIWNERKVAMITILAVRKLNFYGLSHISKCILLRIIIYEIINFRSLINLHIEKYQTRFERLLLEPDSKLYETACSFLFQST